MPLKPHPTDPDKMVYVKAEYNLPKPWVGLTDEEICEIANESQHGISPHNDTLRFAHAIEAKLKEKNT